MWPLEANSTEWSAVGRPPGRPAKVRFLIVVPAVDLLVDRKLANDLVVDRPIDWAISR